MNIDQLATWLLAEGRAVPDTLVPCTPAEIDEVREAQQIRLPAEYERFLGTMGRRAGNLLRGTDVFYPAIVELADEFRAAADEFGVASGSVLLGMHQGYVLYWLDVDGRVCSFTEGDSEAGPTWPSLPGFLADQAGAELRLLQGGDPVFAVLGPAVPDAGGVRVPGRCHAGPVRVGDRFAYADGLAVSLRVESISCYGRSVPELDAGVSAELVLSGDGELAPGVHLRS
ncbi:SMI1/KNR4 family protein [Amycolatopsis suaedae]|uniref:Knr4/Smi1-like domain-containing protein n=1 Tax=Amycolatopsis suaedae TaxID=2510978 RepID=A0A4Q7J1M5_9PSEU|nr:SMI1/KNR4 family protein [Amycolatopsis suaedae]RZQ60747.1 hypothetical protein EWH70_26925 [Amycolatopsis suaedae]